MPTTRDEDRDAEGEATSSSSKGKKQAVFVCEICRKQGLDARYSRIEYLTRHERTHSESKPFPCEHCGKRYARSDVLFRHRRKCAQMHQNGATNGGDDGPVDDDSVPSLISARIKARNESRPYPALDPTTNGPLRSSLRNSANKGVSSQTDRNSPPVGVLLPTSADDSSPTANADSPSSGAQTQFDTSNFPPAHIDGMATLADVMPPLDDAILLASNGNINPFYDLTPQNSYSTASIRNIPPVHQFISPPGTMAVNPSLFQSGPRQITGTLNVDHHGLSRLSQSTNRRRGGKYNRFGGTEPLPWEADDWDAFVDEEIQQPSPQDNQLTPEQTMLTKEIELCKKACGQQRVDISSPFYTKLHPLSFDPARMMYCYMVPKWNMPPASKMSALACRTYNSILEHLGVFHMPTFRLDNAHIWVSFAMCTSSSQDPKMRKAPVTDVGETPGMRMDLEELDNSESWHSSQKLITKEKTELIVRAIYNSSKLTKLIPEEAIPLIHALLLYNSPSFLSEDQSERLAGQSYLSTITHVARNSGLFSPGTDCVDPGATPTKDWALWWDKWVQYEGWRRTAWLVYTLDSLASLDTDGVTNIDARDIGHIPLPYNNEIWRAPTADDWCAKMMDFGLAGVTLDDAMMCLSVSRCRANLSGTPLYKTNMGPFARHIIVLTILRGIMSYGTGKPRGGYVTKRYVLPHVEQKGVKGDVIATHNAVIAHYEHMLDNWRMGWDLDMDCHMPYQGVHFVNDALPPYWLCRALLDRLTPPPPTYVSSIVQCDDGTFEEDGPDRLAGIHFREMLTMSRHFVSNGEGAGVPASVPVHAQMPDTMAAGLGLPGGMNGVNEVNGLNDPLLDAFGFGPVVWQ